MKFCLQQAIADNQLFQIDSMTTRLSATTGSSRKIRKIVVDLFVGMKVRKLTQFSD